MIQPATLSVENVAKRQIETLVRSLPFEFMIMIIALLTSYFVEKYLRTLTTLGFQKYSLKS